MADTAWEDTEVMVDTAWEDTEDIVDTVTVLDTGAMVTITARDPLMPNPKLMPDICMEDTDMVDMEAMEAMVSVMAVDTDIAALVTTEDMVDTVMDTEAMDMVVTTMARDPLMPNQKLMPDICMEDMVMVLMAVDTDIAALDTTEDMVDTVMVLDTEDMAVSGDKHSQVVLPIFLLELSFRKCQLLIICLMSSHPLIRNQCPTFVES